RTSSGRYRGPEAKTASVFHAFKAVILYFPFLSFQNPIILHYGKSSLPTFSRSELSYLEYLTTVLYRHYFMRSAYGSCTRIVSYTTPLVSGNATSLYGTHIPPPISFAEDKIPAMTYR